MGRAEDPGRGEYRIVQIHWFSAVHIHSSSSNDALVHRIRQGLFIHHSPPERY